jgi:prophage DNA circulation protein
MSLLDELYPASYKEADFLIQKATTNGGRKDVLHEFPNSDKQNVEDLGLKPRTYQIEGIISGDNYIRKRDRLLLKIEEGGTGLLVHPFYGNLENMSCRVFGINEDLTELGDAKIKMTFTVSNDIGIPAATQNTISKLNALNTNVQSAMGDDIANGFDVGTLRDTFKDATETMDRMFDAFDDKTKFVNQIIGAADEFNSLISNFSNNITNLARKPQDLADSINNIFQSINGLYATVDSTLSVYENFFGFDDDQVQTETTTVSRIERQTNDTLLKQSMQLSALSFSYLNAAEVEFSTLDEIDEVADRLEKQFAKVVDNNDQINVLLSINPVPKDIGSETISALQEMRAATQSFFDDAKLTASKTIEVFTEEMPARVMTYQYYGSSDLAEEIIGLNDDPNVSFYKGDVKILEL